MALKPKLKCLTQELADVRLAQEKVAMDKQATEDTITAKDVTEKDVLALMGELSRVWTTHVQESLVYSNEAEALKVQPINTHERVNETEYEIEGTKTRLQQLQSGQL